MYIWLCDVLCTYACTSSRYHERYPIYACTFAGHAFVNQYRNPVSIENDRRFDIFSGTCDNETRVLSSFPPVYIYCLCSLDKKATCSYGTDKG